MRAWLFILVMMIGVTIQPIQKQQIVSAPPNTIDHQPPQQATSAATCARGQQTTNNYYYLPQQKTDSRRDAFAPITWSNWALVLVGVGAIIAALCTLGAIRRQAALQETGMRQWLVIQDWQLRDKQAFMEIEGTLRITFDVFNPTNFPLTLESWTAIVFGIKIEGTIRTLLPPESSYLIAIPIVTNRENNERFMRDKLVISIVGSVIFMGVLKDRQEQFFSQVCLCGQDITKFYRHEGAPEKIESENPS